MGKRDVAALIPVVAVLAIDPWGLAPFGPLKWALLPAAVLAACAVLRPRVPTLWLPFLAAATLAAALGADPLYAWIGTPERRLGVVAWILCALAFACGQALDAERRRRVVLTTAGVVAVLGGWAAAEALGWQPFDLAGAGDRPVATLGSSAYLGAAAVLLLPAAAALAPRMAVPTAALGLTALVASGARAAWFGAVAVGVLVVILRRPQLRVVAATAAFAVAVALATGVSGRLGDAATDADGGARGRLDEWRVAARVVVHHPVTGLGPEGYRIDFGRHVDADYERAHGRDPLPDRAHSSVFDIAATTGVVGLAAYGFLLAVVGRSLLRAVRSREAWRAAAAAGVLAYWAQSLFLFPIAELEPVAWLLAGVACAPTPTTARSPRIPRTAAAALAVVALAAGALDVAADRATRHDDAVQATRLRPDAIRYRLAAARALEQQQPDDALGQLDRALDTSPRDPVVRAERARLLLDKARRSRDPLHLEAARRALDGVVENDPNNAEAHLRLGVARALAGDDAGAEQAWRRAEFLAPRSAAAPANLAVAYARAGRVADARAAAQRALAIDPASEPARRVLDQTGQSGGT